MLHQSSLVRLASDRDNERSSTAWLDRQHVNRMVGDLVAMFTVEQDRVRISPPSLRFVLNLAEAYLCERANLCLESVLNPFDGHQAMSWSAKLISSVLRLRTRGVVKVRGEELWRHSSHITFLLFGLDQHLSESVSSLLNARRPWLCPINDCAHQRSCGDMLSHDENEEI